MYFQEKSVFSLIQNIAKLTGLDNIADCWDNSVGQFGTLLMTDFQLFATEILTLSQKFFTNCATHWWDKLVGQFGALLIADFQLFATEILALSQKFFTICATY
ncbi:MAG: hypothetical protein LKF31_06965 [Muribaculaceae bacterium]|jgi:hypothetical protein|nr:hypothetical protein [Muribaculaceae bacterium]